MGSDTTKEAMNQFTKPIYTKIYAERLRATIFDIAKLEEQ